MARGRVWTPPPDREPSPAAAATTVQRACESRWGAAFQSQLLRAGDGSRSGDVPPTVAGGPLTPALSPSEGARGNHWPTLEIETVDSRSVVAYHPAKAGC